MHVPILKSPMGVPKKLKLKIKLSKVHRNVIRRCNFYLKQWHFSRSMFVPFLHIVFVQVKIFGN